MRLRVGVPARLPGRGELLGAAIHVGPHVVRHEEVRVLRPAVGALREADLLLAERRAMRLRRVLRVRRAVRDVRAHDHDARPRIGLGGGDGAAQRLERPGVVEALDVPAVGGEARADVLRERERGVALDRDVVVVVEREQLAEAEVPRERGGLRGHALHEVAVRDDRVDPVVDDLVARAVEARREHALGDGHADRVAEALPERPGRGLDAGGVAELRVARRARAPLAEGLQVVERDVVAREVERRVLEHAGVARAQHEAVAVGPARRRGIDLHGLAVEQVRDRREGHRRPGMARVGLLHRVHGERADRVDRAIGERHATFPGVSSRAPAG